MKKNNIEHIECPCCMRGKLIHDSNVPTQITKNAWIKQFVCNLCNICVNIKIERKK